MWRGGNENFGTSCRKQSISFAELLDNSNRSCALMATEYTALSAPAPIAFVTVALKRMTNASVTKQPAGSGCNIGSDGVVDRGEE